MSFWWVVARCPIHDSSWKHWDRIASIWISPGPSQPGAGKGSPFFRREKGRGTAEQFGRRVSFQVLQESQPILGVCVFFGVGTLFVVV